MQKLTAWVLGMIGVGGCGDQASVAPPPPQVVVRTAAASTAECRFGGTVVSSGLDEDRNGTLDDAEVQTRTALCNDPPVEAPPPIAVRLVSELEGAHCALGGTAVQSGPDRNRNGRLDDDEVEHVDYVCGEVLLTRIAAEPPGPRCIAGGVAFLFGRDRDRDGRLGDEEVEQTEVECGSELSRDVAVRTAADAAALAGITIIGGSLAVAGTDLTELSLPRLVQIRGALEITQDDALVRVEMPMLQAVDGELTLARNQRLTALEMPALHRVASLTVHSNTALPGLNGLSGLDSVVREVRIEGNGELVSADLPVTRIGGTLTVVSNPKLSRSAWSLAARLPRVRIASNDQLDSVEVTVGWEAFSGLPDVSISANARLRRVALSASGLGAIALEDNPGLTEVVLTPGRLIRGDVVLRNNGPLSLKIDGSSFFGLPTEISGSLTLSGPVETLRSAQPLVVYGDCTIDGTGLSALDDAASLAGIGGTLRLINNSQLATIFALGLGGGLEVRGNAALATLGFLMQDEIDGDVTVSDNPVLRAAPSLERLARIHGDVRIGSNPELKGAFSASLSRIDGDLSFARNDRLGALGLTRLADVRSLTIMGCPSVSELDLPALSEVSAMEVRDNAALGHIRIPLLRRTDLGVFDNPQLPACEVAALFARLLGEHHQSGNDEQAVCEP